MLLGCIPAARADILTNGSFETTLSPWVIDSEPSTPRRSESGQLPTATLSPSSAFNSPRKRRAFPNLHARPAAACSTFAFKAGRSEGFCSCQDVPLTFSVTIDGVVLSSDLPIFYGPDSGFTSALKLLSTYSGTVALAAGSHEFAFHFSRGETLFGRNPYIGIDGVSLNQQQVDCRPRARRPGDHAARLRRLGYGVYRRKKLAALAADWHECEAQSFVAS